MVLFNEDLASEIHHFFNCFGSWMRHQFKNQFDCGYPLSLSQFKVLYIIKTLRIVSMSCLSEEMELSKGTMTTTLNRLVEEGLVTRSTSLRDRRTVFVQLSEKGQQVVDTLEGQLEHKLINALEGLSPQQQQDILTGLETLTSIFRERRIKE